MNRNNPVEYESVVCDLCESNEQSLLFKKYGNLIKDEFSFVKCDSCGLVYVNPRLTKGSIADLYDESYFIGSGFDKTVNYYKSSQDLKQMVVYDRIMDHVENCLKHLNYEIKPPKVLEIGFGMGSLIKAASKRGYLITGIDPSKYACQQLAEQGYNVYNGMIETSDFEENAFDVIICVEVLEHSMSPKKFLEHIRRLLKPGGIFYHRTANHMIFKYEGKKADYYMPEGHLYYFTPKTMKQYFDKCGFRTIDFYSSYAPQRSIVNYMFKKHLLNENNISPQTLKEKLFYSLFYLFDYFRGFELPIAQKPYE